MNWISILIQGTFVSIVFGGVAFLLLSWWRRKHRMKPLLRGSSHVTLTGLFVYGLLVVALTAGCVTAILTPNSTIGDLIGRHGFLAFTLVCVVGVAIVEALLKAFGYRSIAKDGLQEEHLTGRDTG